MSHIDLGLIRARHGDLDQLLSDRYPDEHHAEDFHQRYQEVRTALRRKVHAG